jgi:hypothetical protein
MQGFWKNEVYDVGKQFMHNEVTPLQSWETEMNILLPSTISAENL